MTIKSSEEVRAEYINVMGEEFGKFFHALCEDVAWLEIKWIEYVQLYGTKPSRITLMNKAAPKFFAYLESILFENLVLHISRLTDSEKSCGNPNLTIKALPAMISDNIFSDKIRVLVDECLLEAEFSRNWRNKILAHSDLVRAVADEAEPLEEVSRANINDCLESIRQILNQISEKYLKYYTR